MDRNKRPFIGVMVGGVHASFPRKLIAGIAHQAEKEQVSTLFLLRIHAKSFFKNLVGEGSSSNQYDYQFNTIFDYCRLSGVDGMVMGYGTIGLHLDHNDPLEFVTRYNDVPLIIVPEKIDLPNCYSIISDNCQGMEIMTNHLIEKHGCKKILFMRGPLNNTDADERLEGYRNAMEAHGLTVDDSMIGYGDFSEYVDGEIRRLLDAHPDADAFMFSNDEMARGGYRVFKDRGLEIGKDLKVTGYDCGDFTAKMEPPLTTVFQDAYGMGLRSVRDILQILDGENIQEERYPTQLVLRESCGCMDEEKENKTSANMAEMLRQYQGDAAAWDRVYQEYQGKSWFIPMIARDLNDIVEDDVEFSRLVVDKLRMLNAKAAYLFLTDEPVIYDGVSKWECPKNLRLASYYRQGEVKSYPLHDRPAVTGEMKLGDFMDDGDVHQYMAYLLFSGDRQYGLMICDVPVDDISFFYVVSLQVGLSLRYFEISKQEAVRRRELARDMETMRQRNQELDAISSYDELTQLLNRRGMKEQVKLLCEKGSYRNAFVIYCDMDHLKMINDTWGHEEGNNAIRACAEILRSSTRGSDHLARFGGDEFVCLVTNADPAFPKIFKDRLERACALWNDASGKPYKVEISVGVVGLELRDYGDFQKASGEADKLMYEYKKSRRSARE